jgi:PleD family two-component response regulator
MSVGDAPKSKILIAVVRDNEDRMQRILQGHELTLVSACEEARTLLENETFGLVILSVHFDESQMFTLLADIRGHSKYRKVPVVCVLGSWGRMLSEIAVEGLDHAVKAMGANGFLNLMHFPDDDEGNARIRRIVDYLILINGDLQHIARATGERAPEPLHLERRASRG